MPAARTPRRPDQPIGSPLEGLIPLNDTTPATTPKRLPKTPKAAPAYWIADGHVRLNWKDHPGHWGGGYRRPCRYCRRPCFFLDDDGRPVHKVCLEQALTTLLTHSERQAA